MKVGHYGDRFSILGVGNVDGAGAGADVSDGKMIPSGRKVWSEGDCVGGGVQDEGEHAAKDGTDDHGRRPDLVRGTGRKGRVVVAGEDFSGVPEGAVECQESIGAKVGVGRGGAMVPIFGDAGPAGKERPDGAKVIPAGAVFGGVVSDDTHAPVGLLCGLG